MQAIEFVTHIKNGVIEVPKEYLMALQNECRIIILIDADHKEGTKKNKKLTSLEIDTRDLVVDRDEANER